MKKVDVIIVNFRTKELTADAVRSVLQESELRRVIVTENSSGDDSGDYLLREFANDPVDILISEENLGFGGGNNLAAEKSEAEYLFFLNSDATLAPGGLAKLVARLESEPGIGIVAPAIYLADGKTVQDDALGQFPTPLSLILRKTRRVEKSLEPDWVSGVAFAVRRDEYLRLGGFSEELFMYYEDIDLCFRYRKAGFAIVRELSASVNHLGGASKQSTVKQKTQYFQSQDTYLERAGFSFLSRLLVKIARYPYLVVGKMFLWK